MAVQFGECLTLHLKLHLRILLEDLRIALSQRDLGHLNVLNILFGYCARRRPGIAQSNRTDRPAAYGAANEAPTNSAQQALTASPLIFASGHS